MYFISGTTKDNRKLIFNRTFDNIDKAKEYGEKMMKELKLIEFRVHKVKK